MENESIAIVGESGSGKSVFTKTFAGLLDSNGLYRQPVTSFLQTDKLAAVAVDLTEDDRKAIERIYPSPWSAFTFWKWRQNFSVSWKALEEERRAREQLSSDEKEKITDRIRDIHLLSGLKFSTKKQTYERPSQKSAIRYAKPTVKSRHTMISWRIFGNRRKSWLRRHKRELRADTSL